ncbi:MAG TPA: hypothetical protein VGI10_04380 [Polyangiaceae bacterium]
MISPTILDVARAIREATGQEPLTPRWEATCRAFYGLELREQDVDNLAAGTRRTKAAIRAMSRGPRRELWARVGRRGRKSFTMAMLAVYEAMFGGHERYLVRGERGLVAVISKDTAGSTLVARFAELHAEALGVACHWSSIGSVRVLELEGFAFGIACFPCNARAPRGFAVPVIIADEIAHWATDSAEYMNSDESVLGAIKPAMAQFPDAKLLAISSPLGREGMHYETIDANLGGADPDVLAVEGPTWEWNPEISEARTHEIEKDAKTHGMEFGAIPRDYVQDDFFGEGIPAALSDDPPLAIRPTFALDPAFAHDRFGFAVISTQPDPNPAPNTKPRRITYVHETGAWRANGAKPSELLARFRNEIAGRYVTDVGHITAYSDQYEGHSLRELARGAGINLIVIPWTGGTSETSKNARYRQVRAAMYEGAFRIRRGDVELVAEMRTVRSIINAAGHERIETPRNAAGHGDRTSALVLAGSIALGRTPAAPPQPKTQNDEQQTMRSAVIKTALARLKNDPLRAAREYARSHAHH